MACLLALPPSMRRLLVHSAAQLPSVVSTGALSHCLISRSTSRSVLGLDPGRVGQSRASARDAAWCRSTGRDRHRPHRCSAVLRRSSASAPPGSLHLHCVPADGLRRRVHIRFELLGLAKPDPIGSSTNFAAVCTTRSRIVGMPSGRSPPPSFGIITRRTGWHRYAPRVWLRQPVGMLLRNSSPSRVSQSSSPAASIRSNVIPSTPGAPLLARARSYAWRRMFRPPDFVVEQIEPERRLSLGLAIQLSLQTPDCFRCSQAHRQSPHLVRFENAPEVRALSSTGVTQLHRYYDPVRLPHQPMPYGTVEAATLVQHGPPPLTRSPVSTCRSHYPGGPTQVRLPAASPDRAAFPYSERVGVHNFPFEACSGFTHVTARRFAPPPKATFVAGLRYCRLPDRTACQLPGQPTIARVGLAPTR